MWYYLYYYIIGAKIRIYYHYLLELCQMQKPHPDGLLP